MFLINVHKPTSFIYLFFFFIKIQKQKCSTFNYATCHSILDN